MIYSLNRIISVFVLFVITVTDYTDNTRGPYTV